MRPKSKIFCVQFISRTSHLLHGVALFELSNSGRETEQKKTLRILFFIFQNPKKQGGGKLEGGGKLTLIPLMVLRELSHRKSFLGACHKENGVYGLATRKMILRKLLHGKWFLGARRRYHTATIK